jgi:hypothetical protein
MNHHVTNYFALTLCVLALAADPVYRHKQSDDFINVRQEQGIAKDNFNVFFDYLVPCTAGRKCFTDRAKVISTISDGGKVNVTDEAFTELMILNYWNKWHNQGHCKWTDARGGNVKYKGWPQPAYERYDLICRRIHKQRELHSAFTSSDSQEQAFMIYALEKYGTNGQSGNQIRVNANSNEAIDMYNELDE